MKNIRLATLVAAVLLSTLNSQLSTAFAQGSLTPPGAPAATMKTLDQIYTQIGAVSDQRTIVNAANTPGDGNNLFIISQPGSYYLTGNITGVSGKNGIKITAGNVTLDLNGFTLQGVSGGSSSGIYLVNQTNITVRNGGISGWAGNGVYGASSSALQGVFERLNVSANGATGIDFAGSGGVVRNCNCWNNYIGISLDFGSGIISGCTVQNSSHDGIYVNGPTIVSDCVIESSAVGILAGDGSDIVRNNCSANAVSIYIFGSNNRIEDNHVTASTSAGIQVNNNASFNNNIIIKNSVEGTSGGAGNNYLTPGNQIVGPIINATGTINSINPWSNFSF